MIQKRGLLVAKGANPNCQNNEGQTALHFAMVYNFFDLGAWLCDAEHGAGADDMIVNQWGMGPYDGLRPANAAATAGAQQKKRPKSARKTS